MIKKAVAILLLGVVNNVFGATWQDYSPAVGPEHKAGMLVWQDTKQYTSMWIGLGNGDTIWRDPNTTAPGTVEHWRLSDGFWKIMAFDTFSADCIKAELEDLNSGLTVSLPCTKGHFYVPFLLPKDPFRIRNWGIIAGTEKFYWEAKFFPGEQATNPCWYQGSRTVEVMRQQEAWWDQNGGWVNNVQGTPAFDANGTPVRPVVAMAREATLAKGFGVWTLRDLLPNSRTICLYSVWDWQ
jgi:hypothetical protein